jgi:predicted DNA-binding transcriptional regulator AlpA
VQADVIKLDGQRDLALLRPGSIPSRRPLDISAEDSIDVGTDVAAIGHPSGKTWTFTKGIVSAFRPAFEWSGGPNDSKHVATVIQTQPSGQRARQPGIGIGAGCADQRHAAASFAVRLFGYGPMQPDRNEIDLRSSKEVARLLGVTVECLTGWRRANKGPLFTRIGTRKVAYDMRDVSAWLDSHKQRATGGEKAVA